MKDLRIIIVSWNVEKHLDTCLASLSAACTGLDWDVVVVDNASDDGSIDVARRHGATVIANSDNRGFAKACNQGLTGLDARYALLLNPDTECPSGSLAALVREADKHPKAGILGPKLLNTDGSVQTSIRRFPTFWSQVGVMLKLHNFFPGLFRHYFATDLSLEKEQDVDQVMGSCFLIRRELIEQIGGLDERYFIWFEEVDYCRQAHKAGWSVRYLPSVSVTHIGGQSFDQVFSLKKQRYLNNSLVKYFRKWHPGWQAGLLWVLQPKSLALAWLAGVIGVAGQGSKTVLKKDESDSSSAIWKWALVVFAVELISLHTIFQNAANGIAAILVGVIIAVLSFKRPTLALAALGMELLIGSQGHLLQIWGWPGIASLRIVMFVAFFVGWFLNRVSSVGFGLSDLVKIFRSRWEWLALYVVILYGVLRGLSLGNGPVFADANAWIFALLLIPVLDIATRYGEKLKRDILPVIIVGTVWLALKSLGLEYLYAHGLAVVDPPSALHLWVRRTGVGEVTPTSGGMFRIFMQSFIFTLPVLFFSVSRYFATHDKGVKVSRTAKVWDVVLLSAFISLAISLSRSLWLGAIAGMIVVLGLHLLKGERGRLKRLFWTVEHAVVLGISAWLLIVIMQRLPIPAASSPTQENVIGSRVTVTDAASNSRRELLTAMIAKIKQHPILGSGFGATVSYRSSDPRVVAQNPSGLYTTYAFEWGWLEHWVKFGIFGMLLMLVIIYRLAHRILASDMEAWMKYGALASLVGLTVTHVFTPYLNHPLGLGYLIIFDVLSLRKDGKV